MRFQIDIALQRGGFARDIRIHDDARVIAIEGASGCGKTSTLHAIAGLVNPASGRISIDGHVLVDTSAGIDVPTHRRAIGYVFQDLRLFPHRTVRQNLRYGMHGHAASKLGFDEVIDLLGIGALLQRRTTHLSGGEAQRVAIGRALLSQPALLLLDEPLSSLDAARRAELIPYLQRLRDQVAIPMIYVSHHDAELRALADAVHRID